MIIIQHKVWRNNKPPYLDEDTLKDNEEALCQVVDACVDLEGQLND